MAQAIGQMNIVLSANAATFSEAIGQAQRRLTDLAGTSQKMGHTTVTSVQAASGALRELNGDFTNNIRAVERFITTLPGVGSALQAAFPIVGGLAFAAMIGEVGKKIYDFQQRMKQSAGNIREGFVSIGDATRKSGVELDLVGDKLQMAIAKLEHKPANYLKLALDEDRKAAADLTSEMVRAGKEIDQLLKDKGVSRSQSILSGLNPFGSKMMSTDPDQRFIDSQRRGLQDTSRSAEDRESSAKPGAEADQVRLKNRTTILGSLDKAIAASRERLESIYMDQRAGADNGEDYSARTEVMENYTRSLQKERQNDAKGYSNSDDQVKNDKLERQKADAEEAKRRAADAKRAKEEAFRAQVQGFEQSLAALQQARGATGEANNLLLREVELFWERMRATTERGSKAWEETNKRVGVVHAERVKADATAATESAQEDLRAGADISRGSEALRRGGMREEGEATQGYLDANDTTIVIAHNRARQNEARVTDQAGRSLTQYAAAMQMAQIHAQEYAVVLESLQGKLDALASAAGPNPSREQQRGLTEAQDAMTQAQASRSIQARSDADAIYGRSSSGLVGAKDAVQEFTRAMQDNAAIVKGITASTLNDFNKTLVDILTTSRREGGPLFVKHQFEDLGKGVFSNISSAALSKGEGLLFGSLGLSGGKPTGSATNPYYVKSVDPIGGSGTGGLTSILNGGIKLPNVVSSGDSDSSGGGGFFSKIASMALGVLPHFAEGGAISSNTLSMVGERGPELFMPKTSGTIVPNHKLPSMGGHTFNIPVDARGSGDPAQVEAAAHRAVMAAAPHIAAAAMHGMQEKQRRAPLSKR